MATTNVNFKIIEIDFDQGIMRIDYLADGATKEQFAEQAGPFAVNVPADMHTMTEADINQYIAQAGLPAVRIQNCLLDPNCADKRTYLQSLVDTTTTVSVTHD